jgi:hypothetical protein
MILACFAISIACVSAVLAPLAMGAVSDAMGGPLYGFALATGFAALFFGFLLNNIFNPQPPVSSVPIKTTTVPLYARR